jgi:hypothetical protein
VSIPSALRLFRYLFPCNFFSSVLRSPRRPADDLAFLLRLVVFGTTFFATTLAFFTAVAAAMRQRQCLGCPLWLCCQPSCRELPLCIGLICRLDWQNRTGRITKTIVHPETRQEETAPRIVVHSQVIAGLPTGVLGESCKGNVLSSEDGPIYLNILSRTNYDLVISKDPVTFERYREIKEKLHKRYREAIDNPAHFEK